MGVYSSPIAHAKTRLSLLRFVLATLLNCIVVSFVGNTNIQRCKLVLCEGLSFLETKVMDV
jgi:hypothetical protein